jgi:RHS repeat-associated protein
MPEVKITSITPEDNKEDDSIKRVLSFSLTQNVTSLKVYYKLSSEPNFPVIGESVADMNAGENKTYEMTATLPAGVYDIKIEAQNSLGTVSDVVTNYRVLQKYNVTLSVNNPDGGTINPTGVQTITEGKDFIFSAAANSGYLFVNYIINGVSTYRKSEEMLENVLSDKNIQAQFRSVNEGSGLLVNGDFEIDTFGWEKLFPYINDFTRVKEDDRFKSNILQKTFTGSLSEGFGIKTTENIILQGVKYKLSYKYRSTGSVKVYYGDNITIKNSLYNIGSPQQAVVVFTAQSSGPLCFFTELYPGSIFQIDDISLTETTDAETVSNEGWIVVENQYDHLGNLTMQSFGSAANNTSEFTQFYTYDNKGRLDEVSTQVGNNKKQKALKYSYNITDNLVKVDYFTPTGASESISYKYDYDDAAVQVKRGFLKEISNNIGATAEVRFKEALEYEANGNIASQYVANTGIQVEGYAPYTYTFTYDDMNRLTGAASIMPGSPVSYSASYSYNMDGAFKQKTYKGETITYNYPGNVDPADPARYIYTSHRLASVDVGTNTGLAMTYDAKGNLISDGESSTTISNYDHRNLPLMMAKGTENYYYSYNDNGNRILKDVPDGTDRKKEYYLMDHTGRTLAIYAVTENVLTLKSANIYGSGMAGEVTFPAAGNAYRNYYIKDHLGSVRLTMQETVSGTGFEIVSATDYAPYGEYMQNSARPKESRYKFTEKERDAESSYDYFGARYYNNKLGVWLSADPLAEKYPGWNPFTYARNNPLALIDQTGMDDDWFQNKSGDHKWINSSDKAVQDNGEEWVNTGTTYTHKQGNETYTYNQNQLVSINIDVSSQVKWVSQYSLSNPGGACFRAVKAMLSELGLTPASGLSSGDIQVGANGSNLTKATNAIENSIMDGNPIAVGLCEGRKSPNADGVTNHFVLTTGVTYNFVTNTTSYSYFNSGTRYEAKGVSSNNILNVNSASITGNYYQGSRYVSSVRVNK